MPPSSSPTPITFRSHPPSPLSTNQLTDNTRVRSMTAPVNNVKANAKANANVNANGSVSVSNNIGIATSTDHNNHHNYHNHHNHHHHTNHILNPSPDPTMGIIQTSYIWKRTARKITRAWDFRFVVLTEGSLHWFNRTCSAPPAGSSSLNGGHGGHGHGTSAFSSPSRNGNGVVSSSSSVASGSTQEVATTATVASGTRHPLFGVELGSVLLSDIVGAVIKREEKMTRDAFVNLCFERPWEVLNNVVLHPYHGSSANSHAHGHGHGYGHGYGHGRQRSLSPDGSRRISVDHMSIHHDRSSYSTSTLTSSPPANMLYSEASQSERTTPTTSTSAPSTTTAAASANAKVSGMVTCYSFKARFADGYSRTFRCGSEWERDRWVSNVTSLVALNKFKSSLYHASSSISHAGAGALLKKGSSSDSTSNMSMTTTRDRDSVTSTTSTSSHHLTHSNSQSHLLSHTTHDLANIDNGPPSLTLFELTNGVGEGLKNLLIYDSRKVFGGKGCCWGGNVSPLIIIVSAGDKVVSDCLTSFDGENGGDDEFDLACSDVVFSVDGMREGEEVCVVFSHGGRGWINYDDVQSFLSASSSSSSSDEDDSKAKYTVLSNVRYGRDTNLTCTLGYVISDITETSSSAVNALTDASSNSNSNNKSNNYSSSDNEHLIMRILMLQPLVLIASYMAETETHFKAFITFITSIRIPLSSSSSSSLPFGLSQDITIYFVAQLLILTFTLLLHKRSIAIAIKSTTAATANSSSDDDDDTDNTNPRKPTSFKLTCKSYTESPHLPLPTSSSSDKKANAKVRPIPQRFITGTLKDPPGTALKRWNATQKWRLTDSIDYCILQPHPYFATIKRCYPHFYCRKDTSDNQLCYYERPGYLNLSKLKEIGLECMVRHYTFQIEFCWSYMSISEATRTLSGVDASNVHVSDLSGITKEFLLAISKISQEHYPERAGNICILNASYIFSLLWKVIKLMLHPNTQEKVKILSSGEVTKSMCTLIDKKDLPLEYGGDLSFDIKTDATSFDANADSTAPPLTKNESARWQSEFEVSLANYVYLLNNNLPLPRPPNFGAREDVCITEEEFLAGYGGGWEEEASQLHLPREEWDDHRWPGRLFVAAKK